MRNVPIWSSPAANLLRTQPDVAQIYFCPAVLQATARRFLAGFDGLVSYAVKANPGEEVLSNLMSAGITAFDVASPREIKAVRALSQSAALHYHNPVRSAAENQFAISMGVRTFSVDALNELEKLGQAPRGTEISVRLALPIQGGAYDFGSKFGTGPEGAVTLLKRAVQMGFAPSLTFHPGTQCTDPAAWGQYIAAAAQVAQQAGLRLKRLNVGGGFAADRMTMAPDLDTIFNHIHAAASRCFKGDPPALVCEPGRAMVSNAFQIAARVKAIRENGEVFLNDGLYGGLAEARDLAIGAPSAAITPGGENRSGTSRACVVFGPTCDSIDRLPGTLDLPDDLCEGDYLLFSGLGAYSQCLGTHFNGYGLGAAVTVSGWDHPL